MRMNSPWNGCRAVFFDAVGTLLFPRRPVAELYAEIAARRGIMISPPEVRLRLRTAFEQEEAIDSRTGWKTDEQREVARWKRIVSSALRETPDPEACFHELWNTYSLPDAWSPHPEADEVLEQLHSQKLVLGMASNFDARLQNLVDSFDAFRRLRERCVISSLVGYRKPGVNFFVEVARRAECEPQEILMIGDDPRNDVEGARQAGLRALLLDGSAPSLPGERISRLAELLG